MTALAIAARYRSARPWIEPSIQAQQCTYEFIELHSMREYINDSFVRIDVVIFFMLQAPKIDGHLY